MFFPRRVSTGSRLESRANYPLSPSPCTLSSPFPPHRLTVHPRPSLLHSLSPLLRVVPLARDQPTACLPTSLPAASPHPPLVRISFSATISSSSSSSSSSSFSSYSPFFGRRQVRSLYTIGPSYNPSRPSLPPCRRATVKLRLHPSRRSAASCPPPLPPPARTRTRSNVAHRGLSPLPPLQLHATYNCHVRSARVFRVIAARGRSLVRVDGATGRPGREHRARARITRATRLSEPRSARFRERFPRPDRER